MNRHNLFWGVVLILIGAAFLAGNLGLLTFQWRMLWPLLFILMGVYVLLSRNWPAEQAAGEFSIPLDGAKQARLKLEHGAGKINLSGGGPANSLLSGSGSGLKHTVRQKEDYVKVRLQTSFDNIEPFFPWNWGQGRSWELKLNPGIPTRIEIETGASDTRLDLRKTQVTDLKLETGASSTTINMPEAAGYTRAKISGGAASFNISIPQGVAARIHVESGLGSVSVDEKRFPRDGGFYQSADYAKAANKLDLDIEAGVSSIRID